MKIICFHSSHPFIHKRLIFQVEKSSTEKTPEALKKSESVEKTPQISRKLVVTKIDKLTSELLTARFALQKLIDNAKENKKNKDAQEYQNQYDRLGKRLDELMSFRDEIQINSSGGKAKKSKTFEKDISDERLIIILASVHTIAKAYGVYSKI